MINGLKPYPAIKVSGVPWLGDVPEHWEVLPALAVFKPRQVKNTGMIESTVLSLSYGRIIVKPPEKLRGLVPESFETYQVVDPGNIIVRTTDLQNDQTSLRIGHSQHRGIITSAYLCLETMPRVSNKFGYQHLNAYDLLKIIYGFGSGLRQNLDFSDIKRMPVLVPPLPEQSAIVRFLDHADRKIRRYIRAKQKLTKLLEEQKQAIIHRAVTRGLNPNVRLKPSGVAWLGAVPEHWEVKRAKTLFHEVDHRTTTGTEELLSPRMYKGLVPHSEVSPVLITPSALVGFKKVQPGQLVMNRMRAAIGMFGIANRAGLVSPDYAVLETIDTQVLEYFFRLFKTSAAGGIFRIESKGLGTGSAGFMRLYTDRFGMIKLPVPPVDEQQQIVQEISHGIAEIERTGDRLKRETELLHAYRARLIADVVTGQLDVREAAAQLPDEDQELPQIDGFDDISDTEEDAFDDLDQAPEYPEL
jgi:type I restriction enzyme S subunit